MTGRPTSLRSTLLFWLALLLAPAVGCEEEKKAEPPPPPKNTCQNDEECKPGYFCYRQAPDQTEPGVCAQGCRNTAECTALLGDGYLCNDQHLCVESEEKCASDDDCPTTPEMTYCNTAGDCAKGDCRTSDHCGPLQECLEHRCEDKPPICTHDTDCRDDQFCNSAVPRGRCDPGCHNNSGCPADRRYCDLENHRCTDCPECAFPCDDESPDRDLHCPPGRFCDEGIRECRPECQGDESCTGGEVCCTEAICKHKQCVPRCTAEGIFACPEGWTCKANGHCARICEYDDGCPLEQICTRTGCRTGCRDDGRCQAGRYCDLDRDTPVCVPGCRSDEECRRQGPDMGCIDHVCGPRRCLPEADDCAQGSYCEPVSRQCTPGCAADDDCAAEQKVCGLQHECVARCQADEACDIDKVCDRETGHCVFGCRDDRAEPDDTAEQAQPISLEGGRHESAEQRLCAGDEDWFSMELEEGQGFRAEIRYPAIAGDLGLALVDALGATLASSAQAGQTSQVIELPVQQQPLALFLRVSSFDVPQGSGRTYRLTVTLVEPGECADDGKEPNDDHFAASLLAQGVTSSLILCPEDEDWYVFSLLAGDQVSVSLSYLGAALAPSLELYQSSDAGPTLLAVGSSSPEQPQTVLLDLRSAPLLGQYYVRVSSEQLETPATYMLVYSRTGVAPPCADDRFEENDQQWRATPLHGPMYDASWPDLSICPGDEDWFQVEVLPAETLLAEVLHNSASGNLDLELWRGAERLAAAAQVHVDAETILMWDLEPGFYQLRVFGRGQAQNTYRLTVQKRLSACAADLREDNDELADATLVFCGARVSQLVACMDDPDYFEFWLHRRSNIQARLSFAYQAGELDLELLDEGGEVLEDETEETDTGRQLATEGLRPGVYYLDVYSLEERANYYSLELSCEDAPSPCPPDRLEPNDSANSFYPVLLHRPPDPPLAIQGLTICDAADEDWLLFEVLAGDDLDIEIAFFHFSGDLGLRLFCGGNLDVPVALADDTNDNEELHYLVPADGLCYLQIYGTPQRATGTSYDLTITVD